MKAVSGKAQFLAALALAAALLPTPALAQTSPSAFTSGMRYDAARRLVGEIRASTIAGTTTGPFTATRNTYDADGHLTKVERGTLASWQAEIVLPSNWGAAFTVLETTSTSYDAAGNKIDERRTSADGATVYTATQTSYNGTDRPTCVAVRMNMAAIPSIGGNACALGTQGSGVADYGPDRITRTYYDLAGQVVQIRKGVGAPLVQAYVRYEYTLNGKQAFVTDANGNRAQLTYDGFDRQIGWYFPDKATAGMVSTADFEAYDYDANGNRTYWRKRDAREFTYAFDALNRVTSKMVPEGCAPIAPAPSPPCPAPIATRDVYYGYDLRGLQTYARYASATGSDTIDSAYDKAGRQTASTTAMSGEARTLAYAYDADGNRTRITHPDANFFDTEYDGADRPTVTRQTDAQLIDNAGYDALDRQTGRFGGLETFQYDAIGRLQVLTLALAGTTNDLATSYAYNPASQIVSRASVTSNAGYASTNYAAASRAYLPNGLNQYATADGATLTYDASGNLTGDGATTWRYDAENRLIAATGAHAIALRYDPLGRLWQVTGGTETDRRFLYDGDQLVAEYDYTSGALLRRYLHGPGDDDPLAQYDGGAMSGWKLLYADHQGSIIATTNASGAQTTVNAYDEYGMPNAGFVSRFQYTGQAWLPGLDLYHYKARVYSPGLGRFLQTDPVGYEDQVNLYAYVSNDSVNGTDPSGNECVPATGTRICTETKKEPDRTFEKALAKVGTAIGTVVGGVAGGTAGGTAGAAGGLVCGVGAVACSPAAAAAGVTVGTVAGAAEGAIVGNSVGGLIGKLVDKGIAMMSSSGGKGGDGGFKSPTSGSGKEKANDAPSWAKGDSSARPKVGETPNQSATRVLDSKYGSGNYPKGPGSEFSKVQKWHARGFQ